MQLDKLFVKLGLSSSVGELVTFVLVLLVVSLLFWLVVERFRLHNMLINIYISFALMKVLPAELVKDIPNFEFIFFAVFVLVLYFMGKYLFEIHLSGPGLVYWQAIAMSFLQVGLILSIIFSLISEKELAKYVSKSALLYFVSPWAIAVWMIMPLVFLVFVNKNGK